MEYDELLMTPLYCDFCKAGFTSIENGRQHYAGKKHRKRMEPKYDGNTKWYRCDICNVDCNSADQFQDHVQSRRHVEKARYEPTVLC